MAHSYVEYKNRITWIDDASLEAISDLLQSSLTGENCFIPEVVKAKIVDYFRERCDKSNPSGCLNIQLRDILDTAEEKEALLSLLRSIKTYSLSIGEKIDALLLPTVYYQRGLSGPTFPAHLVTKAVDTLCALVEGNEGVAHKIVTTDGSLS